MTFREFSGMLYVRGQVEVDADGFVVAVENVRGKSSIWELCYNSLSFWLALLMVQGGLVYIVTEVLLGENLMVQEDIVWRFLQLWVW